MTRLTATPAGSTRVTDSTGAPSMVTMSGVMSAAA